MNRRVWAIVRREYLQRVRSRWFLFSTIFVPLLMLAAMFLPALLVSRSDSGGRPVAIVDQSPHRLAGPVERFLESDSIAAEVLDDAQARDRKGLRRTDREDSEYSAYLVLATDVMETRTALLLESKPVGRRTRERIRTAVGRAISLRQLEASGVVGAEAENWLRETALDVQALSGESETANEVSEAIGFTIAMLLYLMFVVYGQMIARGVLEEKTSDIVEVMLSSVRPREMMLGKILGVGSVGLTQVGIWGLIGTGTLVYGLAGAGPALAEAGMDLSGFEFPWFLLVQGLAYMILGYLLYASLFASAGAMLSSEHDVQQVLLPVTLPIIVPVVLLPVVIESPQETWIAVLSLFPLFSPILMIVRSTLGEVPLWQTALAMTILVLSILAMARVAGRIYRVGILMKGQRPNLPELIRWVRHG